MRSFSRKSKTNLKAMVQAYPSPLYYIYFKCLANALLQTPEYSPSVLESYIIL